MCAYAHSALLGFPVKMPSHQKFHFLLHYQRYEITNKMLNIKRIPKAVADLDTQEVPNIKATAEKYSVTRKTLEN